MAEQQNEEKTKRVSFRKQYKQYIAVFAASLGGLNTGTVLGWPSPAIPLIRSKREAERRTLDSETESWISGIMNLGAVFALIFVAVIINRVGRKYTMLMTIPLFITGWLVLGLSDNDVAFLAARFILGAASGCFCVACPLYAGEISEIEVRGIMGVCFQLFLVHGILFSYLLALSHDYQTLCLVNLFLVVIFGLWMLCMPDTPYWFLRINSEYMAEASLDWLRPPDQNNKVEFRRIKQRIRESRERESKRTLIEIFKNHAYCRSCGIGILLMFTQQLSGINCVIFNAESIFQDANPEEEFGPIYQAIVIAVVQVLATYAAAFLVDRVGRRMLLMVSLVFMACTLTALGAYFFFRDTKGDEAVSQVKWLPTLSLCFFIAAYSLGAGPVPWAMIGEIFPEEIKSTAACIAGIFNWLLAFLVTKTYINLKDTITVAGTFWFYAVFCLVFYILIFLFLVETRGRTFEIIQGIMAGEHQDLAPIGLRKRKKIHFNKTLERPRKVSINV